MGLQDGASLASGGVPAEPVASPIEAAGWATTQQFVTFSLDGESFAVALADVREIIRLPDLVDVPMSPPSLKGVANLRGTVLPVASLRRIFGMEEAPHDDASRVVVVNDGRPLGFIVDRVARVITAEPGDIEEAEHISASIPTDMVSAVIKRDGDVVMIVSPRRLFSEEFGAARRPERAALAARMASTEGGVAAGAERKAEDEVQLVSFLVDAQEYAFPIESVQEIVTVPGDIARVPNSDPAVVGVITLRERLLAVLSLRRLFGLPPSAPSGESRIVVVSLPGPDGEPISVGVVMDTVKEVLRVPQGLVGPVPPVVSRGTGDCEVRAICRLEGGSRLVSILSARDMFRGIDVKGAVDAHAGGMRDADGDMTSEDAVTSAKVHARDEDDEELFVVFRLASGEYGVPIHAVKEIVRAPDELTAVPRTPESIRGVVNLRGAVLPVIDQRTRFGLPRAERNDRQRIMVLILSERLTGFIVDSVSEVLKVPRSRITAAPELSEDQAEIINRVINLEEAGRIILLVEVERLADSREFEAVARALPNAA